MRGQVRWCVAVCLLALGCSEAKPLADDTVPLNGSWIETAYLHDGASPPPEHFEGLVTVIEGDKFVRKSHGQVVNEGELKVTAKTQPMQFEGFGNGPDGTRSPYKGILQLEGNRLVLCFDRTGKTRPEEFESTSGSGFILMTLERSK